MSKNLEPVIFISDPTFKVFRTYELNEEPQNVSHAILFWKRDSNTSINTYLIHLYFQV